MIVGGAETYILRKAEWLIKHGHEVIVISAGGCYEEQLPKEICHYELKELTGAPYSFSASKLEQISTRLSDIIKEKGIDIIEAHNTFPIYYVIMSYSKHYCPFILNVLLELNYDNNFQLCLLTYILNKKGLYFTLTKTMNNYIENKCRTHLSPQIIPIPLSLPIEICKKESKYLLSVCRLSSDKMYVIHLIHSFEKLMIEERIDSDIRLIIVGDGELYNYVNEIATKVNKGLNFCAVLLKGTIIGKELDDLYKNCMAYIGVGTTLLIAASFSKPIILASGIKNLDGFAYGYWGNNETLDRDSITGTQSYNNYKMTFENAIEKVTNNEMFRKELSMKSYTLFNKTYDIDKIMNKWEDCYRDTINVRYDYQLAFYGKLFHFFNLLLHPVYIFINYLRINVKQAFNQA